MPSLFSVSFWLYFVYFFAAFFIAFYIPGNLLLRRLRLSFFDESVLSIITGIVMFSLQGFLFGYFNLRILTFFYLIVAFGLWLKTGGFRNLKKSTTNIKTNRAGIIIAVILIAGTLVQLSTIWLNGILTNTLYFCCGIPDTLFSLSLTHELINRFPPNEPAIFNISLQNYHYLTSLVSADLIRVFRLPEIATQYQYLSVLISLLLGLASLTLANMLKLTSRFKIWFLIFLYFTGDIIFILPLFTRHVLDFSLTTLENASSLWISPPRMWALIILLGGLSLLVIWVKKRDRLAGAIMALVLGSLVGFKVYIGIVALAGLAILGLWFLIKRKRKLLIPLIFTAVVAAVFYIPVNKAAGGLLFSGFWRFEDFAAQPSLGLSMLELARRVYLEHFNYIHAYFYDLIFGFCYLFFSAGMLVVGLFQTRKSLKPVPVEFNIFSITVFLTGLILGLFFLQNPGGANSSQFLIVIYIIGSFYGALSLSYWLKKINPVTILAGVILFILISTRVGHDSFVRLNNIANGQGLTVTKDKMAAFNYLKNLKISSPILLTSDTSGSDCLLVTFLSDKIPFACSAGAPGDRGVNLTQKFKVEEEILSGNKVLAKQNSIIYIFDDAAAISQDKINSGQLKLIFKSSKASIYKII